MVKKNAKIQQLIVIAIDKNVVMHILNYENSHGMYKKLSAILERDTEPQKSNLLKDFFSNSFSAETDIVSHISRSENIAFKMKPLNKQINAEMVISKVLSKLLEQYKHFKTV